MWLNRDVVHGSLSCACTFFRHENVKHFVLIDEKSDIKLDPLFDTLDWTITIAIALDQRHHASNVIIITSAANFNTSTIYLTTERVYVILNDDHQSIDGIGEIFSKFNKSVRRNVIVIGQTGNDLWHFYRFIDFDCTAKNANFVEDFVECVGSGSEVNLTNLPSRTSFNEKMCPLTIAATKFEPFTFYDESRGFYKGIDYSLVETIAQRLQFEVNFIEADVKSMKLVPNSIKIIIRRKK